MLTRRDFCTTTSALALAGWLPSRAFARQEETTEFRVTKIREGVWAFSEGDRHAKNSGVAMLVATADTPVLIDTKFATMASDFAPLIKSTAGKLPGVVINTHHHPDHIGGNFEFRNRAQIIGHVKLKPRVDEMLRDRVRPSLRAKARDLERLGRADTAQAVLAAAERMTVADFAPDREFDKELAFEHGGVKFVLRYFGHAHTDNDIAIYLPDYNVAHLGDLLFHRMHAFIDRSADASAKGWQEALAKAEAFLDKDSVVIAGHGDITDITALKLQRDYFDQLRSAVQKAIDEGKSREEITRLEPPAFRELGNQNFQGRCLGAMYDELTAMPK